MGIEAGTYSRPAKFSTIIADADLDIGTKAILTTNLALLEGTSSTWYMQNRAKSVYRNFIGSYIYADIAFNTDVINEKSTGNGVTVDGLLVKDDKIMEPGSLNEPQTYAKVASNNNRHSHSLDIHLSPDCSAYAKIGGMVFTNGLVGTIRVECDVSSSDATARANIKYMVSGVQKGVEQDSNGLIHANYHTNTQDIALDLPAGGELELWLQNDNTFHHAYAKNWKIDYDNAADAIAVGQTEA